MPCIGPECYVVVAAGSKAAHVNKIGAVSPDTRPKARISPVMMLGIPIGQNYMPDGLQLGRAQSQTTLHAYYPE